MDGTSALSATAAALDTAPLVVTCGGKDVVITTCTSHDDSVLAGVMQLMAKDLSEPYSIFTYRYFIMGWPQYCLLVRAGARALARARMLRVGPLILSPHPPLLRRPTSTAPWWAPSCASRS